MTRPDTADVIRRLATAPTRVRRLAAPWVRAAIWVSLSVPCLVVLYLLWPRSTSISIDRHFVIEQVAALTTGLTAAVAAFSTVVPGRSRRLALLPLLPLAVWIASLGQQCARSWPGTQNLAASLLPHWACLPATIVAGAVPALVIVMMLRRGAPVTPRLTLALASLSVAGIANVGVRFVHPSDPSLIVLTWHVAAVIALSSGLSLFGEHVLTWPTSFDLRPER
jgi:hypothetical protein